MNRTLLAGIYPHRARVRPPYLWIATLRLCLAGLAALAASPDQILAQVSVLTANGDNNRTNANLHESHLTPQNVRPNSFGKLGAFPADGQIYAQPLYVSNLLFPNGAAHNVLFITTMHNTVYAYDADMPSAGGLLWQVNLGQPFPTTLWNAPYTDISPEIGILGTGAIDLDSGVLYVVAETLQNGAALFSLHALDLRTGAERMNGPVAITAQGSGSGAGSLGGVIPFDPGQHMQRPGLLLSNGAVYVAFGSHMDQSPWHGWVMSYDASDLTAQRGVFLTTPNGEGGAVWQSGRGLAADDVGSVYSMTGNGDFDGVGDFGESFVKLWGASAALADWFTPANWKALTDVDADLSTGPAVIPGTHQIVGLHRTEVKEEYHQPPVLEHLEHLLLRRVGRDPGKIDGGRRPVISGRDFELSDLFHAEGVDLLPCTVLVHLEVFRCQVGDRLAALVPHAHVYQYEVGLGFDDEILFRLCRRLLSCKPVGRTQ